MSRKTARENALKLVYEYCIVKEKNELTLTRLLTEDIELDDLTYLKTVYNGVIDNYEDLTSVIEKLSKGFALDRLYKIDLSILLISLYELKYLNDIPQPVSVNEAVELSKLYSTEKSSSFINGILAAYIKGENDERTDN